MPLSKSQKLLIPIGFILLIAFIIYSTTGLARVSCEVCMEFNSRQICKPAAGTTQNEAIQTAKNSACADIAGGRDESIACNDLTPIKSTSCK
jgi:hypothetical protein